MGLLAPSSPQSAVPEQIVLTPPKIGVATFYNPSEPTAGVACLDGGPLLFFENRMTLPADVLWVSNAKDAVGAQNFRPGKFFRVTLNQIAIDLGYTQEISPQLMSEEQREHSLHSLRAVSRVIARTRDLVVQSYGWTDFSEDWSYDTLALAIGKHLPPAQDTPAFMEQQLMQAYQDYSAVETSISDAVSGSSRALYTLTNNRLRYAQYICSQPIPTDTWWHVPNVSAMGITLTDLLNPDCPSLTEVTVECNADYGSAVQPQLVAFGCSRYGPGRHRLRRWVSQPELAWLVEYAKVTPLSAYISTGVTTLGETHQLPSKLVSDELMVLSLSCGLVAENHWLGITAERSARKVAAAGAVRWVKTVSPAAVWLRACDRAYCFQMARIAAEKGFSVSGYGRGSVSFYAPKDDLTPVMELAEVLQTSHPNLDAVASRMIEVQYALETS